MKTVTCEASTLGVIRGVVWETLFVIILTGICYAFESNGIKEGDPHLCLLGAIAGILSLFLLWDLVVQTKYDIMEKYEVNPLDGRIIKTTFGFPHSEHKKVIKYDRILKVTGGRRMFLNAGSITVRYVTFLNTKPETNEVSFNYLTDPISTINELTELIEKDPAMEVTTVQKEA